MKNVLFISHCAGRTGAPLMLLNLLKWMKQYSRISFEILLMADGPLTSEFAALAPVHHYPNGCVGSSLLGRIWDWFNRKENKYDDINELLATLNKKRFDLIYSNTIVNGMVLQCLSPLGCPVITHVHELDHWIKQSGEENLAWVTRNTNLYIAASNAVKQNLVGKYAFPSEKIKVVHSFIPAINAFGNSHGIRQQLGIPKDAFVVIGSGYETWRKGKDLFVQLTAKCCKLLPGNAVHSLWVGGWQDIEHYKNVFKEVQQFGLENNVHFVGEVANPLDYFSVGDVFAMVSRDDPFPLVCLEAAALGKPIVCFADSGGMPEFVCDDAGFVVPYLDLDEMAAKVSTIARDVSLSESLGKVAQQKVKLNYDVTVGARKIAEIIENL